MYIALTVRPYVVYPFLIENKKKGHMLEHVLHNQLLST